MTSNKLVANEIQDRNMVFTPLLRNQLWRVLLPRTQPSFPLATENLDSY